MIPVSPRKGEYLMWKWFRALGLLFTGRFKKAYQALMENEYVMEATYDASIEKGKGRVVAMSEAIGGLVRLREDKVTLVNTKSQEYQRLQQVKAGALAKAKDRAALLQGQGKSPDQIKADAEYLRCQGAYNSADVDAKKLDSDIKALEGDIAERSKVINAKKLDLQRAKKQQDDLKSEKHEAIAEVLSAKQEEEVARQLAGLENDTTDTDLAAAREARKQAKSRSKVMSELAGTDHQSNQDEFASYATVAQSHNEFDNLIGLDSGTKTVTPADPAKLPES